MTPEQINREIAEKVMGWIQNGTAAYSDPNNGEVWFWDEWNPAERIDHAWMVVEKLGATIQVGPNHDKSVCYFWLGNGVGAHEEADTAPMAICLAALEAVKACEVIDE
jgi:hypothetical protein